MSKTRLGPTVMLYPMPAVLVGADVDGKPIFLAIAWCGIVNSQPPMLSVALQGHRYTLKGIRQQMAFSVNVPSVDLAKETDFCGIRSGAIVDKVTACNFDVFYGQTASVPLIRQCPVNLECHVAHMLELGSHWLIVGRVEETHVSNDCLTDNQPDVDKIRPVIFVTHPAARYQAYGEVLGRAFSIGQEIE